MLVVEDDAPEGDLAEQDIAADLYFFKYTVEGCYLGAAVFKIYKQRET